MKKNNCAVPSRQARNSWSMTKALRDAQNVAGATVKSTCNKSSTPFVITLRAMMLTYVTLQKASQRQEAANELPVGDTPVGDQIRAPRRLRRGSDNEERLKEDSQFAIPKREV